MGIIFYPKQGVGFASLVIGGTAAEGCHELILGFALHPHTTAGAVAPV
jgi:hypothetical protein